MSWLVRVDRQDARPSYYGPFGKLGAAEMWAGAFHMRDCECERCLELCDLATDVQVIRLRSPDGREATND
jgi:hypothetical protein